MIDDRTAHYNWPQVHPENNPRTEDVPRLREMAAAMDETVHAVDAYNQSIMGAVEAARDEAVSSASAATAAAAAVSVAAPKLTLSLVASHVPETDPEFYDVAYFNDDYRPGSGGRYRKQPSEPTGAGKVQNGNGTWYRLDDPVITPEKLGAAGDGV